VLDAIQKSLFHHRNSPIYNIGEAAVVVMSPSLKNHNSRQLHHLPLMLLKKLIFSCEMNNDQTTPLKQMLKLPALICHMNDFHKMGKGFPPLTNER